MPLCFILISCLALILYYRSFPTSFFVTCTEICFLYIIPSGTPLLFVQQSRHFPPPSLCSSRVSVRWLVVAPVRSAYKRVCVQTSLCAVSMFSSGGCSKRLFWSENAEIQTFLTPVVPMLFKTPVCGILTNSTHFAKMRRNTLCIGRLSSCLCKAACNFNPSDHSLNGLRTVLLIINIYSDVCIHLQWHSTPSNWLEISFASKERWPFEGLPFAESSCSKI